MSNDDYAWQSGAIYDARNVDLSSSKWVKLSRSFNLTRPDFLFTEAQWAPTALLEWQSQTYRLIASRNWWLKNFINTEYDISAKTSSIFNMWSVRIWNADYWFILWNSGKIWRWQMDTLDLALWIWAWWVNITDTWVTLPLDISWWSSLFSSNNCPYLVKWWRLYITAWSWNNHNVFTIDVSTTTWTADIDYLALDRWYSISYMSFIWDQIIVYATNWNQWKQYFWDWLSNEPERVIDWYDKSILWGATLNNIDYVITWTFRKRELYQVQWYQAQKIFETDVSVNNTGYDKFFFETTYWISNLIETIWDTLVLPWQWWIYKYWNNKIWLPKNITRDRLFWLINLVYYNDKNSSNLIVCTQTSSYNWTFWYYIASPSLSPPNDNTNIFPTNTFWIIEWLKFDWWNYAINKEWVKLKVWYALDKKYNYDWKVGSGINIYARVDDWYEYANFYTYVYDNWSYTTKPAIWDVYTVDSQNFTVYDITDRNNTLPNWSNEELKDLWLILHCKCSNPRYSLVKSWNLSWVLTKVSWVWDSSLRFYSADEWYQLVWKIRALDENDFNRKEKTIMMTKKFNQIQFKFDLFTNDWEITPILYDFYLQYNIIQNDIWN